MTSMFWLIVAAFWAMAFGAVLAFMLIVVIERIYDAWF